jgi:tetratricopeptide (TPR) repeat protein
MQNSKKAKTIKIHNRVYQVNDKNFKSYEIPELSGLKLHKDVGKCEKMISLINECQQAFGLKNLVSLESGHGGFIPIEIFHLNTYQNVFINKVSDKSQEANILANIPISSKNLYYNVPIPDLEKEETMVFNDWGTLDQNWIMTCFPIVLSPFDYIMCKNEFYARYSLTGSEFELYIPKTKKNVFEKHFHHFLNGSFELDYDNLLHLCMIVKNSGKQLENMLLSTLPLIDRWTIIDTGSSDETAEIVNRVLASKRGKLYQMPFVDFSTTRNLCLDLAGSSCKYTIMLDDTYYLHGNLRDFLNKTRDDLYADSFSMYIQTNDVLYASVRIIVSDTKLRYKYRVHEVFEERDNVNVIIPQKNAWIDDKQFEHTQKRTNERKNQDVQMLMEDLQEDPNNPRTYYYIAQTYLNMKNYEKAYEYFLKRGKFAYSGYIQERFDAIFEAARIANFNLNKPWNDCLSLYQIAISIDDTRPEPYYYIGVHQYANNNENDAFQYFKKAYQLGVPLQTQFAVRPIISHHFVPKFLTKLCYQQNDYALGKEVSSYFLQNNNKDADAYKEIESWNAIFSTFSGTLASPRMTSGGRQIPEKPIFVFLCETLCEKDGLLEIIHFIHSWDLYKIVLFCNKETFKLGDISGISVEPIENAFDYLYTTFVDTCIVFKNLEYLPITFKSLAKNVYFLMEKQTLPTTCIFIIDPKLNGILCMTNECVKMMSDFFPSTKERIVLLQEPKSKRLTAMSKNMFIKSISCYHRNIVATTLKHNDFSQKGYFAMMKIGGYNQQNNEFYTCLKSESNAIFIEPIPTYFENMKNSLNQMHDGNKFIYVNACASNNIGKMNLFYPSTTNDKNKVFPLLYSNKSVSFVPDIDKSSKQGVRREELVDLDSVWVRTVTINQLAKDFEIKELFFLIVETDFHDFEIVMSLDFKIVKPKYIKFMSQNMTSAGNRGTKYNLLVNHLEKNGYKVVEENEHTTLMMSKS